MGASGVERALAREAPRLLWLCDRDYEAVNGDSLSGCGMRASTGWRKVECGIGSGHWLAEPVRWRALKDMDVLYGGLVVDTSDAVSRLELAMHARGCDRVEIMRSRWTAAMAGSLWTDRS